MCLFRAFWTVLSLFSNADNDNNNINSSILLLNEKNKLTKHAKERH